MWDPNRVNDPSVEEGLVAFECGFPCQPYAPQGLHQGEADELGRGEVIHSITSFLGKAFPKIFVLENVAALTQGNHRAFFDKIIETLRNLRRSANAEPYYNIRAKVLDTYEHGGLPQSRKRVYIVGISDAMLAQSGVKFSWPCRRPALPLEVFYDRNADGTVCKRERHESLSSETFRQNIQQTYRYFKSSGIKPDERHMIVNIGGTPNANGGPAHFSESRAPTLTSSRCGSRAYYSTWLKRRLSLTELARLQGLAPRLFQDVLGCLSEHQAGKVIGNAMSVPVLALVLRQALLASGIAIRQTHGQRAIQLKNMLHVCWRLLEVCVRFILGSESIHCCDNLVV